MDQGAAIHTTHDRRSIQARPEEGLCVERVGTKGIPMRACVWSGQRGRKGGEKRQESRRDPLVLTHE